MPPRTNDFQDLVTRVEAQLAPEGATVTPSAMLSDSKTGEQREVDVLIEHSGHHVVRVGVECVDHGRPASVEWVDKMIGKYRDLPIDKVILVSKSGFTKSGRQKAEGNNMRCLTLAQAAVADWQQITGTQAMWYACTFLTRPLHHSLRFRKGSRRDAMPSDPAGLSRLVVHLPDGKEIGNAEDVARELIQKPALAQKIGSLPNGARLIVTFAHRFPNGTYVLDGEGGHVLLDELDMEVAVELEKTAVPLQPLAYGDVMFSDAKAQSVIGEHGLTVVKEGDRPLRAGQSLRLRAAAKGDLGKSEFWVVRGDGGQT